MIELVNENKYISAELVEKCYRENQHTLVDKRGLGIGFTTGFLNKPSNGLVNIIIAPNREVVISKQKSYIAEGDENKQKIGFIYGNNDAKDSSDIIDFKRFNVLMFVSDSLLLNRSLIESNLHFIGDVLIDESHSVLIQSTFRKNLVFFTQKVCEMFKGKRIVSVTASPLNFQKPDIVIINTLLKGFTIHTTEKEKDTLERLKKSIKEGKKTILATNDRNIMAKLKDKNKKSLKANFKIGAKLRGTLSELCVIEQDDTSNLVIVSAGSYEGWDLKSGVHDVFLFSDLNQPFSTQYVPQMFQLTGRSRKGVGYVEFCIYKSNNGITKYDFKKTIDLITDVNISDTKKMSKTMPTEVKKFGVAIEEGIIDDSELTYQFNEVVFNLHNELAEFSEQGISYYDEFFKNRNITIMNLDDTRNRLKSRNLSDTNKDEMVLKNAKMLEDEGIVGKEVLLVSDYNGRKGSLNKALRHLRFKYYFTMDKTAQYTKREVIGMNILSDENEFNDLCSDVVKIYIKSKADERKTKAYSEKIATFKNNVQDIVAQLTMMFINDKITLGTNIVGWRDYNLLTRVSMDVLYHFGDLFDVNIEEYDIKNCNPRILYACVGLELPNNFYGNGSERDKNKRKINSALNSVAYNPKSSTPKRVQRLNKIKMLLDAGFDLKVVDFVIENFFDTYKDAVFNYCAKHERNIIRRLLSNFSDSNTVEGKTAIRRHDSIITFGEKGFINAKVDYKGVTNWFDYDERIDVMLKDGLDEWSMTA